MTTERDRLTVERVRDTERDVIDCLRDEPHFAECEPEIRACFAAARRDVENRSQYMTPEEQGRMTAAFEAECKRQAESNSDKRELTPEEQLGMEQALRLSGKPRPQGQGQATWTGLVQENAALRAELEAAREALREIMLLDRFADPGEPWQYGNFASIARAALTKQEEGGWRWP